MPIENRLAYAAEEVCALLRFNFGKYTKISQLKLEIKKSRQISVPTVLYTRERHASLILVRVLRASHRMSEL